mmetsp:Transcript_63139/g.137254  ORF Transcript_63139/g.137254 Transcript_63139/m.137254 type:complete len:244 (-) Transcript_63139:123-854(-)
MKNHTMSDSMPVNRPAMLINRSTGQRRTATQQLLWQEKCSAPNASGLRSSLFCISTPIPSTAPAHPSETRGKLELQAPLVIPLLTHGLEILEGERQLVRRGHIRRPPTIAHRLHRNRTLQEDRLAKLDPRLRLRCSAIVQLLLWLPGSEGRRDFRLGRLSSGPMHLSQRMSIVARVLRKLANTLQMIHAEPGLGLLATRSFQSECLRQFAIGPLRMSGSLPTLRCCLYHALSVSLTAERKSCL